MMRLAHINGDSFFSKIIDSIQDGLSILAPDLTVVWVNKVIRSWFSSESLLEGRKCYEIYYQQNKPCQICPALSCLRSGRMSRIVAPGFNESCPRWLEITCFPLKAKSSSFPVGVVKFIRDVSTTKHLEMAKRDSEGKLRRLFECASDGIFTLDINGFITSVNKKFLDIWQIKSKDTIIGKNILELVAFSDSAQMSHFLEETLRRGPATGWEFRARRRDGSEFYAEIDASILRSDSGEAVGFIGIIRDITSRKETEQELYRYRYELEKIIEERTAQLTRLNAQLEREMNEHKKTLNRLARSELSLRKQKKALERKNIALRELISQVELEKENIKNDIAINIRKVIFPILDLIKKGKALPKMLALLQYHLERIAVSYGRKIYGQELNLTPKEVEICHLVCAGLASKDISSLLNISVRTVEKHRRNIRKKLGLSRQHINLTSFLRQF